MTSLRFHRGRFYKLVVPVGPIPAGIYRCIGQSDGEVHFTVGRRGEAIFSLENVDSAVATPVSFATGRRFSMRPSEFISSYHKAEEAMLLMPPPDPGMPALTCCMMSVLVSKEAEKLSSRSRNSREFDA